MPTTSVTTKRVVSDDGGNYEVRKNQARPYLVAFQFFDFLFLLIEGLLLTRFLLQATGAYAGAGFVQFVYSLTAIFMAPFRLVFPASATGEIVVEWSVLLAMMVYALVYYLIRKLIAMVYAAE